MRPTSSAMRRASNAAEAQRGPIVTPMAKGSSGIGLGLTASPAPGMEFEKYNFYEQVLALKDEPLDTASVSVLDKYAWLLSAVGEYDIARRVLEFMLLRMTNNEQTIIPQLNLGLCHYRLEDLDAAESILKRLDSCNTTSVHSKRALMRLRLAVANSRGDEQLKGELAKQLGFRTENGVKPELGLKDLLLLGSVLAKSGNIADAMRVYLDGDRESTPVLNYNLAICSFALGNSSEAIGYARKFLERCPKSLHGKCLLGSCYLLSGNVVDAQSVYESLPDCGGSMHEVHPGYGILHDLFQSGVAAAHVDGSASTSPDLQVSLGCLSLIRGSAQGQSLDVRLSSDVDFSTKVMGLLCLACSSSSRGSASEIGPLKDQLEAAFSAWDAKRAVFGSDVGLQTLGEQLRGLLMYFAGDLHEALEAFRAGDAQKVNGSAITTIRPGTVAHSIAMYNRDAMDLNSALCKVRLGLEVSEVAQLLRAKSSVSKDLSGGRSSSDSRNSTTLRSSSGTARGSSGTARSSRSADSGSTRSVFSSQSAWLLRLYLSIALGRVSEVDSLLDSAAKDGADWLNSELLCAAACDAVSSCNYALGFRLGIKALHQHGATLDEWMAECVHLLVVCVSGVAAECLATEIQGGHETQGASQQLYDEAGSHFELLSAMCAELHGVQSSFEIGSQGQSSNHLASEMFEMIDKCLSMVGDLADHRE